MKEGSNNTNLWRDLMAANTPEEKKNILKEEMQSKSINYNIDLINKYNSYINEEDQEDKEDLIEDSKLNQKSLELKKIIKKLKSQALAERIARGDYLNKKEIKYLKKNAPQLIAKAKAANIQRKNLENRIKAARTSKEAEDILFMAKGINISIMRNCGKEDGKEFSALLNEAYKKSEKNTCIERMQKREKENINRKHIDKCI